MFLVGGYNLSVKCTVNCDFQKDGFCTTIPTISNEYYDVQMCDEVIGEPFPVCQTIKTEKAEIREKEYIDKRFKELHEESMKRLRR